MCYYDNSYNERNFQRLFSGRADHRSGVFGRRAYLLRRGRPCAHGVSIGRVFSFNLRRASAAKPARRECVPSVKINDSDRFEKKKK